MKLPDIEKYKKELERFGEEEEERFACAFCGEDFTYRVPFKVWGITHVPRSGRKVAWELCDGCHDSLVEQLQEPKIHGADFPKGAFVFPESCLFCGVTAEYDHEHRRYKPLLYELDMSNGYSFTCATCGKELLDILQKTKRMTTEEKITELERILHKLVEQYQAYA